VSNRYPPIADYGLIGDCHSAALVSRTGSIDWCCLPRFDSGSCFGRLMDWKGGGHCTVSPTGSGGSTARAYVEGTMVLETVFRTPAGEAKLIDFFAMREGGRERPRRQIIRIVECLRGRMDVRIEIAPRFDYGEVRPWMRRIGERAFAAIGGNDGLVIASDAELSIRARHDLEADARLREGERMRLSIRYLPAEEVGDEDVEEPVGRELDRRLDETVGWWRRWRSDGDYGDVAPDGVLRSAVALKALTHAPTGAMVAAPTTSLPEVAGGDRNWDYRFSWIRDSAFAARALTSVGHHAEADGFRRFVERSSAGSAEELQVMFGVGGERRLAESTVDTMAGYRGASPVRVGNGAYRQEQHDMFGQVLDLAWEWHRRGHSPHDDHWEFLVEVVDLAARRWSEPDRGLWEVRSRPQHFVHSKVMCWTALDRGLRLAEECDRRAPVRRWRRTRGEIRSAVEDRGYRSRRGVFVRAFSGSEMDAALLLLPRTGFVDWRDERMVRTVDAVREDLEADGLLYRFRPSEDPTRREGAFVAATFWLVECLARQGRADEARTVFDRAAATGNDLGLFAEEYDPRGKRMLGNFPQGFSHLSHILAADAVRSADDAVE
jgi:GH15 family glucan-1,4-alpha-glucosidase